MYSETDKILDGKKSEKFRQRAIALRRVSFVLMVFGILKVVASILLWRDGLNGVTTLVNLSKTKLQHNYLSLFVSVLGFLLIILAIFGLYTSKSIEHCHS